MFRVLVDGRILLDAELHSVPVVDVAHPAPWSIALDVPLITRRADFRRSLLELDRVAAGVGCLVDQGDGIGQVAVVVDADLTSDIDRIAGANHTVAQSSRRGDRQP